MSPRRVSTMNAGFTLVEVVISISLGTALMVGLWTVFDIFTALQERANTQSARTQLTRGLFHQLQDDLNRVQSPAVRYSQVRSDRAVTSAASLIETDNFGLAGANETAAGPTAERIAFFGSQSWLIMDLARTSYHDELETDDFADQMTGDPKSVLPTSRVIYHFVSPDFAILDDSIDGGLTRWKLSNPPTQIRDVTAELDRGEWGTANSIVWQTAHDPTAIVDVAQQATHTSSQAPVTREQIPEIKRFLLRYFDGADWRTTWDSRRDGSLPLSVECLLVWRDNSETSAVALNVETLAPAELSDVREELEEINLSTIWENFGQQDFSATSARLPKGFGRYVLYLPAGLPPQRTFADTPAVGIGERLK